MARYTYTIQGIENRSWRWGQRCEIRIYATDVDPKGRGYRDRCKAVWGDYDGRYRGPRSALGQAIAEAEAYVARLNGGA